MSLELLGIIVNGLLAGVIALYVIWDHVKDDRLLTKQVQAFYEDIEKLIFYHYTNQIIIEFQKLYEKQIEFPLQLQELNEYSNRHYYYRVKVKNRFVEFSDYLGLINSEEGQEEKRIEYINETYTILTDTGSLGKRQLGDLRRSTIKDLTNIDDKEIEDIDRYLHSLRSHWNKQYHKFIIKPKLQEVIKFKRDLKEFINNTDKTLKPTSKEEYLTKGNLAFFKEAYADALNFYNKVVNKDPNYKEAWLGIGRSYLRLQLYDKADDKFDEALKIDPDYADAWYYKASLASLNNKGKKAVTLLQEAVRFESRLKIRASQDQNFKNINDLPIFKKITGIAVFFSYSARDVDLFKINTIAQKLSLFNDIQQVFYMEDISVGGSWVEYFESAINYADVFILFASVNSRHSDYVRSEWQSGYKLDKPIIPVFIRPHNIPAVLARIQGVKFNEENIDQTVEQLHNAIQYWMKKIT